MQLLVCTVFPSGLGNRLYFDEMTGQPAYDGYRRFLRLSLLQDRRIRFNLDRPPARLEKKLHAGQW